MQLNWITEARNAIADCSFQDYTFLVVQSETTKAVYLQATYLEADTITGNVDELWEISDNREVRTPIVNKT